MNLNIALCNPLMDRPRGAQKQISYLAYNLAKKGHAITLYTFKYDAKSFAFADKLNNVTVVEIDFVYHKAFNENPFFEHLSGFIIAKAIANNNVKHDVYHPHNSPAQFASLYLDIPSVWMCNEYPLLHKPLFLPYRILYSFFKFYFKKLFQKLRNIDVLVLDNKMKKKYNAEFNANATVIYSGFDAKPVMKSLKSKKDHILIVSALQKYKRIQDVIIAISKLPSKRTIVLDLVGEGTYQSNLLKLAKEKSVTVKFHGYVSENALNKLYALSSVSVFPAVNQPWGIAALEGITAGVPTVISHDCGAAEVLEKYPFIFRGGDVKDLTTILQSILKNKSLAKKKTLRARDMLTKNYSWKKYSERVEKRLLPAVGEK